jgi:hypothetical protein
MTEHIAQTFLHDFFFGKFEVTVKLLISCIEPILQSWQYVERLEMVLAAVVTNFLFVYNDKQLLFLFRAPETWFRRTEQN